MDGHSFDRACRIFGVSSVLSFSSIAPYKSQLCCRDKRDGMLDRSDLAQFLARPHKKSFGLRIVGNALVLNMVKELI
jgi:hypothetical protein